MSKADFDAIYTAADPRPYYRTLGRYDYQIPLHAGHVFSPLARAIARDRQARVGRRVLLRRHRRLGLRRRLRAS